MLIKKFIHFLCLFTFWIILSGHLEFLTLFLGFLSVLFVMILNRDTWTHESISMKELFLFWIKLFFYIPWLTKEILMASVHVSKIILSPKMPLNPGFHQYHSRLSSDVLKVIFANSITLTPGTVTADIQDQTFTVYALDKSSAEGILNGSMESKIYSHFNIGKMV